MKHLATKIPEEPERRIARSATPQPVAIGTMILVPTDERRRSGSHYTPRSLTEPIVRTTLEPIFRQLGENPTPDQILNLKICDPAMGSGAFLVEACRQLAEALVRSWIANGYKPYIPPDEDELLHARRLVAQRCLYGVDRNPMAVDLAKLSLWLVTLAKDQPFTFLDHSLRCGDSLVGLTRRQIIGFHWEPKRQRDFQGKQIEERIQRATSHRIAILNGGDDMLPGMKLVKLQNADTELNVARLMGDACISAFFAGSNAAQRNAKVDTLFASLSTWAGNHFHPDHRRAIAEAAHRIRTGIHLIPPFHWEIEFPEVFRRDLNGFDAFVGNPPFAGKNTLINGNREGYLDWLKMLHEESHGNSDLVAHFFRRAFNLLRPDGCFGLIATNTIGQGDTRSTGLRWICTHGGNIYNARKRVKWPGMAAVVVSVVHVSFGDRLTGFRLNDYDVPLITAYLFHAGGHESPRTLSANAGKSFIGHFISGPGFTFDDNDSSGLASPVADAIRLLRADPKNRVRILPYIGGDEVLNSSTHAFERYVISFEDLSLEEASKWPDLLKIVIDKVKPERVSLPPKNAWNRTIAAKWWLWGAFRKELRSATSGASQVLFHPNVSTHLAFAFIPSKIVVGAPHNVFAFESFADVAILQSRVHEVWARFFSSSLEDRLRYSPTDCFETFPFPTHPIGGTPSHGNLTTATSHDRHQRSCIESVGRTYYESRAAIMIRYNEGLTKTYNRFHDRDHDSTEPDPQKVASIQELRRLHAAMDDAVLRAYGWGDLADRATCEFLLEYEEEESEEETSSRRKKPWRYRWPDEFRDEVLARLLALNAQRATEERLAGATTTSAPRRAPKKKATKRTTTTTPSTPAAPKKAREKRAKGDREMF